VNGSSRPALSVRLLSSTLLALAATAPLRAGFLDFFRRDINVITVTDTTPAGALLRRPTKANPVYYAAINVGYREIGGIVAGEHPPSKEEALKTIMTVLAKQGYLPATNAHPPTLLLMWMWGTLNTELSMGDSEQQINRGQLLRFLGGYKLGLVSKSPTPFTDELMASGLSFHSADAQDIADAATDDLYVAAIAAYDYQAATRKERVQLWMTKISCPSRGFMFSDVLPVMLTVAGSNIGRETAQPVWVNASDKFKPDIKIGDATVTGYLDPNQSAVVDAPMKPLKKPAAPANRKP
jgi:hypothetical protein